VIIVLFEITPIPPEFHRSLMEESSMLSKREERAIMLETQTPAYALTSETRRAIDLKYQRAANLRKAFRDAGIDVPVSTRTIVPYTNKWVSGLNVPNNIAIVVGKEAISSFVKLQNRAKKALKARNR
jgi:hypothetical protein